MTKRILMVVGLLTLVASTWAMTAGRSGAAAAAAAPAAKASDVIAAPGRVEAMTESVDVSAEITGRLEQVYVDEGDRVNAGQVIATIDPSDARAKLASAEAQLSIAKADLDRLLNGARVEERREADAQRKQAEAAFMQTENERQRRADLFREGFLSQEELERADRDMKLARARLDELTERASVVSASAREDEKARATAAVALAESQVAQSRSMLAKTEIRAPQAGTILRRYRKTGEVVAPEAGTNLIYTMADTSRLRVRVDVDETDVARLAVGQRVEVRADAYGDTRFGGVVSRVGQMLGAKNLRTDRPTEKNDAKILETMVDLDAGVRLPLGLRVDVFIRR